MKELLIYLYNSTHPHSTDIKFDDQFGNEKEVEYLVSKLVKLGVVSIVHTYYTEIQVKVEPIINTIAKDFDYDIDKYIQSHQKHSYVKVDGNAIIGDNNKNINQGFDSRFDIKSKKDIKQIPIDTPNKKSSQDIWDKLKSVAQILGFVAAVIALITKLMDLW